MGKAIPPRKRQEIIEFVPGPGQETVAAFCRRLQITRTSFYRIRERAESVGVKALVPDSRAPRVPARRHGPETDEQVAQARAMLESEGYEAGPLSVWWLLRRQGLSPLPSTATIGRSLRRQGLVEPNPRKRPKSSYTRFQRAMANELWQLDGIYHEVGGQACTIYQIVDDHSRLMVALVALAGGESAAGAKLSLTSAIARFGTPAMVLTDNGTAFNTHRRGWLSTTEKWLADQGIRPISGRPVTPTTQGKIERSHRPVKDRLAAIPPAASIAELNTQLEHFRDYYNNERQHQGHGLGITPARMWSYAEKATALPEPIPYAELLPFPATWQPEEQTPHQDITGERHVGPGGRFSWSNRTFYIGQRNAGRTVPVLQQADRVLLFNDEGRCFGDIPWPQAGGNGLHINVTKPPHYLPEPPHAPDLQQ